MMTTIRRPHDPLATELRKIGRDAWSDATEQLSGEHTPATADVLRPIVREAMKAEYDRLVQSNVITPTTLLESYLDRLSIEVDTGAIAAGDAYMQAFIRGQRSFDDLLSEAFVALEDTNERLRLGRFTLDHWFRKDDALYKSLSAHQEAYRGFRDELFGIIIPVLRTHGGDTETARQNGYLPDELWAPTQ